MADEEWYKFDDQNVTRLPPERLERELRVAYGSELPDEPTSAYMLMYRARPVATTADAAPEPAPDAAAPPSPSVEPAADGAGGADALVEEVGVAVSSPRGGGHAQVEA